MNRISLIYTHTNSAVLFTVHGRGLSHAQLRHYAEKARFHSYMNDDLDPVIVGAGAASKSDLLCLLESAGYEVDDDQVVDKATTEGALQ